MRAHVALFPVLAVIAVPLLGACGAAAPLPANAPPARPDTTSTTATMPSPAAPPMHGEAVTMGPPTSHCPPPAGAPTVTTPDKNDAPLTLTTTAKGVTLESSGASAGRVLAAIALASKTSIEVHGAGAAVRIYARARDQQPEALLRSVASVAGLDVTAGANGGFVVGHARTAPEVERRMRAARIASAQVETRLFAARDAVGMANVLALTTLSCRGLVTAAPERGIVVVTDVKEVLDRTAQVVDALDSTPPKPLRLEIEPVRGPAYRMRQPRCANVPQVAAANGAAGKLSAEGTAAGDLLVRVARAKNEDVVVGCGGDLPAYFAPGSATPSVADAARAVGMTTEGGVAYASNDLALAQQAHAAAPGAVSPAADKHEIRTFTAAHVRELAAAADDLLGDPAAAAPYEPASTLVVSASSTEVAVVEKLVREWSASAK